MFLIWRAVFCIISPLNQTCFLCCGKQWDIIVVHICLGLRIFLMVTTYTSSFCSSCFSVTCICGIFLRPGDNRFVAECRHNVCCQGSYAVKICISSECTRVYLFSQFKPPSVITWWLEFGVNCGRIRRADSSGTFWGVKGRGGDTFSPIAVGF